MMVFDGISTYYLKHSIDFPQNSTTNINKGGSVVADAVGARSLPFVEV